MAKKPRKKLSYKSYGTTAGVITGTLFKPKHNHLGKDTYASVVYMGGGALAGRAVGAQIDKYRNKKTQTEVKRGNRVGKR